MNLRTKLAALFSPTLRLIGSEAAPVRQGGLLGGRQWVVPRVECQYRRLDLTAVPARQRPAAARLAVSRVAPSPGAVTHVTWCGGIAHLWIWAAPSPVVVRAEQHWIPETLLAAPPASDGPRLLRMVRGVEGQVWQAGQLMTSQWWPQSPDPDAWQRFLRAAGLDPDIAPAPPEPVSLPWSVSPWGERQRGLLASTAVHERMAWTVVLALLALALGWQVAGLARWQSASTDMATRLEAARARAAPVLAARARAEQSQADTEHLLRLQHGPSDYVLMGEIIETLPEGAQLRAWQRESAKLQVAVQGGESDPRKVVSAFGKLPHLADVTATPVDGGGMQLVFTLPGGADEGKQ